MAFARDIGHSPKLLQFGVRPAQVGCKANGSAPTCSAGQAKITSAAKYAVYASGAGQGCRHGIQRHSRTCAPVSTSRFWQSRQAGAHPSPELCCPISACACCWPQPVGTRFPQTSRATSAPAEADLALSSSAKIRQAFCWAQPVGTRTSKTSHAASAQAEVDLALNSSATSRRASLASHVSRPNSAECKACASCRLNPKDIHASLASRSQRGPEAASPAQARTSTACESSGAGPIATSS